MNKFLMALRLPRPVFAPEDPGAGGAGADTGAGGAGTDTLAGGGSDTLAAGGEDTIDAGAGAGEAKWWEDQRFSDTQRKNLTALGLTTDDPLEAVLRLNDMEISAKKRLGAGVDQLMQKPKKGQDVAEWLKENRETFGLPQDEAGYEVERPDDWPQDAKWNEDLEAQARKIAHEEGLSGKALNRFVGLFAGEVKKMLGDAETDLANASTQMMTDLQKDWGDQTTAKITQAQQAASVLAEKAGLSAEAVAGIASVLKPKVGDAGTIRLFAAVGEMMGEDSMQMLAGGGGAGFSTTPAEARQKLQEMRAPGGEFYEASAKGDRTAIAKLKPTIERLSKIAAG